jgi:hypothetical protein
LSAITSECAQEVSRRAASGSATTMRLQVRLQPFLLATNVHPVTIRQGFANLALNFWVQGP